MIIIAGGSEVAPALQAKEILEDKGFSVRVVSMVSREIFERQDERYRQQILPDEIECRLAVEAALPLGWERYTGSRGSVIGVTGFGASAPGAILMEKMGFTAENIACQAEKLLGDGREARRVRPGM